MGTIRVTGYVDEHRRLTATVPAELSPGKVEIVVLAPGAFEDEAGDLWMAGIAREWHDDLNDPRQDIYTLSDGVAADGAR